MPTQSHHLESSQDLALLLGPREADIMRLLWTRGPATVREIHTQILPKAMIAYTTVMSICVQLAKKGLLERRRVTPTDAPARPRNAYMYAPRISEADFTRVAVEQRIGRLLTHYPVLLQEQLAGIPPRRTSTIVGSDRAQVEHTLAYLGTLCDAAGQHTDDAVLDTIAVLLQRAETAERTAETNEAELGRSQVRVDAAEQRAQAAEGRAEIAEWQMETALRQMNRAPQPEHRTYVRAYTVQEYRDVAGICRVCGRPAPPQSAARHDDDLRVCREAECRQEARRRDNNAKQRRSKERRQAGQAAL